MPIDLLVFGVAIIDMDTFITSITKRKNFFSNGCEIGTKVISIFANTKNGVVVLRMKGKRTKYLVQIVELAVLAPRERLAYQMKASYSITDSKACAYL